MVYNGKVITEHISGCMRNEEICDIDLLVLHVYPFSNVTDWNDECKKKDSLITLDDDDIGGDIVCNCIRDEGTNVVLLLLGGLLSGVCGAFITFLYLSKNHARLNQISTNYDESLEMTTSHNDVDATRNASGKIYGLQAQQEGRDII